MCGRPLKTSSLTERLQMLGMDKTGQHTSVWTMCGLCSRRLLTVWKTSKIPSAFTRSRTVLRAQKVPVRPAPALKQSRHKLSMAPGRLWMGPRLTPGREEPSAPCMALNC